MIHVAFIASLNSHKKENRIFQAFHIYNYKKLFIARIVKLFQTPDIAPNIPDLKFITFHYTKITQSELLLPAWHLKSQYTLKIQYIIIF